MSNVQEMLSPKDYESQLNEFAKVEVKTHISSRIYCRTGHEMLRMAEVYENDNEVKAYLYYVRFLKLFLVELQQHPDYSQVDKSMLPSKSALKNAMQKAEKLKTKVMATYNEEYQNYLKRIKSITSEKAKNEKEKISLDKNKKDIPIKSTLDNTEFLSVQKLDEVKMLVDNINYGYDSPNEDEDSKTFETENTKPNIPSRDLKPMHKPMPEFDRSKKPRSLHSKLRDLIIPTDLVDKFLEVSEKNTSKNIETCGILAGSIIKNCLHITHLLIPQQTGTSDSCNAENEEELFEYQNQKNLFTFGWIHVHPSQTAFLSSIDLHTQWCYQLMIPEAIAIVCAPSHSQIGYFALTQDKGMEHIGNCSQKGFHQHSSNDKLYEEPSHVTLKSTLGLTLVDFRK